MKFVRYILNSINPLNIILIVCAIIIGFFALSPYFYQKVFFKLPAVPPPQIEEDKPSETGAASPSLSDYVIIAEQNLFHPDRKIPLEKKEAQQIPKPELILYGTLITEEMSIAYVEDKKNPKTSPGRGKRQTVMKKGDSVSGFVLREIEKDKIVLVRGDETMVVHLNQGDKPRISDAPGVVSAGAKPTPTPTPVAKPTQPTPVAARPGSPQPVPPVTPQPSPRRNLSPPLPGGSRRPQNPATGSATEPLK